MSHYRPHTEFVTGSRGCGKSTLTRARIANLSARGVSVWVIDPMLEHSLPIGGRRIRPNAALLDSEGMTADGPLYDLTDDVFREAWLRKDRTRPVVVVCDDLNLAVKRGQQGPPFLNLCVMEGRHRNVGFVMCVRRPAEVPRNYSSQADHWAVFRTRELIDQQALYQQGVPKAHALAAFPVGYFLHQGPVGDWHAHYAALDSKGRLAECMI